MTTNQLEKLFVEQIGDLYDAEKQLVKALPKLERAADSKELATAIREHLKETEMQVKRLEQVFEVLEMPAKAKSCKAMKGLIQEGGEAIEENRPGVFRDLAIIAAAQRVEHYEISAYGTARAIATVMGNQGAAKLLLETEQEESAADEKLTEIAITLYGSDKAEEEAPAKKSSHAAGSSGRAMGMKMR